MAALTKEHPKETKLPYSRLDIEMSDKNSDNMKKPTSSGAATVKTDARTRILVSSFILMIVIGLGNKIFQKLQTIPMHNYPFFLNLMSTFIYIPASFLYIIPVQHYGTAITKKCTEISKWKFAVMGTLDGISGVMNTFAVNYITNSSMIILLTQASIPISMFMSKFLLRARYTRFQYMGAGVVIIGIAVVLIPSFAASNSSTATGNDSNQLLWALVLVASCVPQVLSSVYKEKALGETDVDVIYMNGWIAIYQFAICIPLAIPSAYASNLSLSQLPQNTLDGAKCYVGIDSIFNADSMMPADDCSTSLLFVTVYLCFNLVYNVLLIMILKYGSANILWLAMTIMVPLGNVAFSLDFVPGHMPLKDTDMVGLGVIMLGLVCYRFADKLFRPKKKARILLEEEEESLRKAAIHGARYVGVNNFDGAMLEPLIDVYYHRRTPDHLKKSPLQIRSSYLTRLGFAPSPHSSVGSSNKRRSSGASLLSDTSDSPSYITFKKPKL